MATKVVIIGGERKSILLSELIKIAKNSFVREKTEDLTLVLDKDSFDKTPTLLLTPIDKKKT